MLTASLGAVNNTATELVDVLQDYTVVNTGLQGDGATQHGRLCCCLCCLPPSRPGRHRHCEPPDYFVIIKL